MEIRKRIAQILVVIMIITSMRFDTTTIIFAQTDGITRPELALEVTQKGINGNEVQLVLSCKNESNQDARQVIAHIDCPECLCTTTSSQIDIDFGDISVEQSIQKEWTVTVPEQEKSKNYLCTIDVSFKDEGLENTYTQHLDYTLLVEEKVEESDIILSATPNSNSVLLVWNSPNEDINYSYMIYQKHINTSQSSSEFQSIPANDEVKVLQIAPSHPQLVDWVKEYGQGKIKCESVSASSFNRNPNVVWDYDVIVFGFADCNGGYDLNQNSRDVVEKYIKSGKGVLFGHDTINDYIGHVYFDSLASYANLTLEPISGSYQNEIRIAKKGLLTNYPYMIGEVGDKLRVPTSHISRQVPHGDVWMLFNGDNTCYLTTWNNCALIQTGHSGGAATQDEQKLLMNTIYYLAQRTSKTSWIDHMGQDLSEPLIPEMVTIKPNNQNNTLFINVSAKDQGDDYQYYVESTHPDDGEIKQSNIESIHLESGIKGYSIVIDTKADTVPDDEIETTNGCYELKLPEKDNDQDNYYIHVKAIDNANNISQVL